jgi:hypothetical protein
MIKNFRYLFLLFRGRCSHCGRSLAEVTINDDIFRKLVKSMMDDVIIGSDIYYKTNPKELQNFKTFVEKTKPYDIVIDSLNITHKDKSSPQMVTFIYFFKIIYTLYIQLYI